MLAFDYGYSLDDPHRLIDEGRRPPGVAEATDDDAVLQFDDVAVPILLAGERHEP